MKIVLQNKRTPRKYTEMRSISLCDDQGITWARIHVSYRGIEVDHIDGARVTTHVRGGLGFWDLDNEFNHSWQSRRSCPKCQEDDEVYDPQNQVVKCKSCGEVY